MWLNVLTAVNELFPSSFGNVTFAPCARTDWHMHPEGQILLVTGGEGYVQLENEDAQVLHAGDVAQIEPGAMHWHGAAKDGHFNHVAITINNKTEWGDPVTDEQYNAVADKEENMDRIEKSKEQYEELFGNGTPAMYTTDPELQDILSRFIFGEVAYQGEMDNKTREMLTITALTVNQTLPQLKAHIGAALNVGVTPVEIKETLYQCTPYIGFPKVINAVNTANEVFTERGIELPIEPQGTVNEDTRFEEGLATQIEIFGDGINLMRENAPENQKHIQDYLSAMCFGDFYTRNGLDLKQRELITLCAITTLGGADSQVKSHIQANVNVGNSKETIITAITQCMPYIGFPRTLNALSCVNEIIPEND